MLFLRLLCIIIPVVCFSDRVLDEWNKSEECIKKAQSATTHEEFIRLYKEAWDHCQHALNFLQNQKGHDKDQEIIHKQQDTLNAIISAHRSAKQLNEEMVGREKSLEDGKKQENRRSLENVDEITYKLQDTAKICTDAANNAKGILSLNPFPFRSDQRAILEKKQAAFEEAAKQYKKEAEEWPCVIALQKEELKKRWAVLKEEAKAWEGKGQKFCAKKIKEYMAAILKEFSDKEAKNELENLFQKELASFEKEPISLPKNPLFLTGEEFLKREQKRRELFFQKLPSNSSVDTFFKERPCAFALSGQRKTDGNFEHYLGQFYQILLQSDQPISYLTLKVYQKNQLVHEEKIEILKKDSMAWDLYLGEGMVYIPETTLDTYGIDLRIFDTFDPTCPHSLIVLERGLFSDYQCTISIDDKVLYSSKFLESPPWQLETFLQKPSQLTAKPFETANNIKIDPIDVKDLKHPEIAQKNPLLDRLVEELFKKDPKTIASYVQNEIALVDPFLIQEGGVFYAPGIQRSAQMTFLEKQGTPWEQCMLLVYLLRQAGYKAIYADGIVTLPKTYVENLFCIKNLPIQNEVFFYYPWVIFFDGKEWVSLFPWMKEVQIHEGYDLYSLMPKEYASADRWIFRYLQNDPQILKHIGQEKDDSAGVLFVRFVEEKLKNQGFSLADVGLQKHIVKKQFSSWEKFPRPKIQIKGQIFQNLSMEDEKLFAMLSIQIGNSQSINGEKLLYKVPSVALNCQGMPIEFISDGNQVRLHAFEKFLNLDASTIDIKIDYTVPFFHAKHNTYNFSKTLTIEKNTSAAICFHFCGDSQEVTSQYLEKVTEEKDPNKKNFALLNFVGAAYFEKCSHMQAKLATLHKTLPSTVIGFGLAKLKPFKDQIMPQVDMVWSAFQSKSMAIQKDYFDLAIADISSNEHQIIHDIFQDPKAISTVKLLQLAHEEHAKNGLPREGFLTFTPSRVKDTENMPEAAKVLHFSQLKDCFLRQMKTDSPTQWNEIKKFVNAEIPGGFYAFAFATPGLISSPDKTYQETGALIFHPNILEALISNNSIISNGGLGTPLNKDFFAPSFMNQWQLNPYGNSYTLKTPNNPQQAIFSKAPDILTWQSDVRPDHKTFWNHVADPVDVVTGAFYIDEVDLFLPGTFPMEIRRNYNSQNPLVGVFGPGWKLSLNTFLVEQDGKLFAAEMDGTVIAYRWNEKTSRHEVFPEDNFELCNIEGKRNPYQSYIEKNILYGADGSKRIFEKNLLQKWVFPNGNAFNFSYEKEHLSRIENSSGQFLGFHYNPEGKISEIYANDGRRIYYRYNAQGDLAEVILPNQATISYQYDASHRILKETKPHGKVLENVFDDKGRVVEQLSFKGPQRKMMPTVFFTYEENCTKVKDALGGLTTYKFFKKQIYKIIDPKNFPTYQSWYIDKNSYFDAEQEKVLEWKEKGGFFKSLKSSKDKRGLVTSYLYDDFGNFLEITLEGEDLSGNKKTKIAKSFKYNAQNLPIEEKTSDYTTLTTYDENFPYLPKKVEKFCQDKMLSFVEWTFNQNGQVIKENFSGNFSLFTYDDKNFLIKKVQLTGTSDPDVVTEYRYNDAGDCIERKTADVLEKNVFDIMGNKIQASIFSPTERKISTSYMSYNLNNQLITKQGDNDKDILWLDYDSSGLIKATKQTITPTERDAYTLYQYDVLDRLTEEVDALGNCTYREYDAIGKMVKETREKISSYFSYEPGGLVESIISPSGAKTTRLYTTNGFLKEEIFPDGTKASYVYDAFGRPLQETKNNITWEVLYDDANHRIIKTHPATKTQEISEYDLKGNLVRFQDAAGNSFEKFYDGLNRLKTEISATGEKTTYNYAGNEITILFANGEKRVEKYENGQVVETKVFDASGHVIYSKALEYDTEKLLQTITEGNSLKTITYFNNLGQPIKIQKGDLVTCYEYDLVGNCIAIIDGEGKKTLQKFDAHRRLIQKELPDGAILSYSYDADSNLVEYHLPNELTWKASYDSMGRKTSENLQKNGQTSKKIWEFFYENGDLKQSKDPMGRMHTYVYDALGRLLEEKGFLGNEKKYAYDPRGLLTSIEQITVRSNAGLSGYFSSTYEERSLVERSYDKDGRLTLESIYLNRELLSQCHQSWRPSGRTLQIGNHTRDFTYQNHQLVEISTKNTKLCYGYNFDGSLQSKNSPLTKITMEYNLSGLPEKITSNAHEEILSWNSLGKLAKIQSFSKNLQKQFSYNSRGFLQTAGVENFEFDFGKPGVGVRTLSNKRKISQEGLDPFGKVVSETAEKEEIISTYDAMGQMTQNGTKQLEWDFWGRLLKVFDKNLSWEASYDGLGRRIQTRLSGWVSTTVTNSFYDPEEEFKEIGIATQGKMFWKIFGPDGCDAVEDEKGSVAYLVQNGLKHLSEIVTSEGSVECGEISPYGPQGKPILEPDLISYAKSINWHSQSQDPTGFIYLGARYYDPESGRFLSQDPVSYPIALDLYGYANGDPINNVDLDGRFDSPAYEKIMPSVIGGVAKFNTLCNQYAAFGFNFLSKEMTRHHWTRSDTYEVGAYENPNLRIIYMNGIRTSKVESIGQAEDLSSKAHGYKIHGIYSASYSVLDVGICFAAKRGFHPPEEYYLEKSIHEYFSTANREAKMLIIGHSGANIYIGNVLERLSEEYRKRIMVLPIAPARIIPDELCYSSDNYVSENDRVIFTDIEGMIRYRDQLKILKAHPNAKGLDHEFMSPTFDDVKIRTLRNAIEKSGGIR